MAYVDSHTGKALTEMLHAEGFIPYNDALKRYEMASATLYNWCSRNLVTMAKVGSARFVKESELLARLEGFKERQAIVQSMKKGKGWSAVVTPPPAPALDATRLGEVIAKAVMAVTPSLESVRLVVKEAVAEAFKERGL